MPSPGTMRLAPTERPIDTKLQMSTAGMPALSSSFTIVAPQRVPVPQVEARITPALSRKVLRISAAISRPNRAAFSTVVAFPTVV